MAEKHYARLEIVCALIAHLGFKSLTLRQAMMGNHQTRSDVRDLDGSFFMPLVRAAAYRTIIPCLLSSPHSFSEILFDSCHHHVGGSLAVFLRVFPQPVTQADGQPRRDPSCVSCFRRPDARDRRNSRSAVLPRLFCHTRYSFPLKCRTRMLPQTKTKRKMRLSKIREI